MFRVGWDGNNEVNMLTLVLLIVVAICIILVFCMAEIRDSDAIEELIFFSGLVGFILLIVVLVCTYNYYKISTLSDQKIKLYTELNKDNENNKKITNCKLQKIKSQFYRKLIVPFS